MISLYLMIPLGLVLSALAIWLFVWALKGGQFEDLDSPGWSIIMDEERILSDKNSDKSSPEEQLDQQSTEQHAHAHKRNDKYL